MIRILLSRKLGELRWTQADLARKTGIRPTTINELYHEMAERVNLEHLSEILVRTPNTIPKIVKNRAGRKLSSAGDSEEKEAGN